MNLAFRISNSYQDLEPFVAKLSVQCTKLIIYQHQANRVHIHGLAIACKVSTDTLKNYVKSSLGVTSYPKTDWSFKTIHDGKPVGDEFIIYMSKGTLEPMYNLGYESEYIQSLKSKWVDKPKKELVQYKIKVENPREAKIRQNELMDMV